jgi:hypothetical protein
VSFLNICLPLQVFKGDSDIGVDIPYILNHPQGQISYPVYYQIMTFVQTKPKLLSPESNLALVFEKATWLFFLVTFTAVAITSSCIYLIHQKIIKVNQF